jgi:GST-like protein
MIDLYAWSTSNGKKASIALEEMGLAYQYHPINIGKDEQFTKEFIAINPNSKIPAIIDRDGPGGKPFALFESGAILIYLAEKSGKLMSADARLRYETIQWVMFQMGGIGPIFGQVHHFLRNAPGKAPYAEQRFTTEARRLYGVLDTRLGAHRYLMDEYSIADIATWPWVSRYEWQGIDLAAFPNVKRWHDELAARPQVQKGLAVLEQK